LKTQQFPPPKRRGLTIHILIILALAIVSIAGFSFLTRAEVGRDFLLSFLAAILPILPLPFIGYSAYSLQRANYTIDRNHLSLQWGLRTEEIPLSDIDWMRPAKDLTNPVKLPLFALTGSMTGMTKHAELGMIEYLASDPERLVLVVTSKRIFALSPAEPGLLLQAFAHATELGSLTPVKPKSVYPSFIISQAWDQSLIRFLWLSGALLILGLFVWVTLLIPGIARVALGSQPGRPGIESVPSTQMILLPVASLFLFLSGWLTGLYLFRWDRERPLAYVVWISGSLMVLLFLIAAFFTITTPV
jgi:hypothetical protein